MSGAIKNVEDGNWHISWDDYKKTHKDYKGIWTNPESPEFIGKRTLMVYDNGTCLVIEGHHLIIEGAPKRKVK